MKKIIRIEIYKFFKKRKNLIILALIFLYMIGINFYYHQRYNEYMLEEYEIYVNKRFIAEGMLNQDMRTLENEENLTIEEKKELERRIEFYTVEKNELLIIEYGLKENKPNSVLISENDRYKNIFKGLNENVITEEFLTDTNLDIQEMHKKIHLNQYILDNRIQPILNPYTMTGSNSLVLFLEGENLLILMFFLILLSIDIYLSEIEEGSYKILYNQSYKRNEIFLGKIITILIISLVVIILSVIINFIAGIIVNGVGDINYPFITSYNINKLSFEKDFEGFKIIPLWEYVIRGFILFLSVLFFSIIFVMFISIFTDSVTKTMGISIILLILSFVFHNFVSSQSILNQIYPYSFVYIKDVIVTNNGSNYLFGILLNIILTISFFAITYYKIIRKDFLGAKE